MNMINKINQVIQVIVSFSDIIKKILNKNDDGIHLLISDAKEFTKFATDVIKDISREDEKNLPDNKLLDELVEKHYMVVCITTLLYKIYKAMYPSCIKNYKDFALLVDIFKSPLFHINYDRDMDNNNVLISFDIIVDMDRNSSLSHNIIFMIELININNNYFIRLINITNNKCLFEYNINDKKCYLKDKHSSSIALHTYNINSDL